ncbi:MAG TPA: alpha/beta hydrolase [Candidatus Limnocylindria bacterium]|nr:alpha/beta hydrolase [Candidatus Limnocylindria bacterium]
MREESRRIAGRLEATLRIPDVVARGIAVVSHPLPTHGGTMRNPLVAGIARAIAAAGLYALRFNFRGVGESAGEWTGGVAEVEDLDAAVTEARAIAPGVPLALTGFSFGAVTTLRWLANGGRADAVALAGVPLRSVAFQPHELPPVPDGTFIVAAELDQFGTASELRSAYPRARIVEVTGVDHFFGNKRNEVGALIAGQLVKDLRIH